MREKAKARKRGGGEREREREREREVVVVIVIRPQSPIKHTRSSKDKMGVEQLTEE